METKLTISKNVQTRADLETFESIDGTVDEMAFCTTVLALANTNQELSAEQFLIVLVQFFGMLGDGVSLDKVLYSKVCASSLFKWIHGVRNRRVSVRYDRIAPIACFCMDILDDHQFIVELKEAIMIFQTAQLL